MSIIGTDSDPRYSDWYGLLSYADFLAMVAAGTLTAATYAISLGEDKP